MKRAKLSDFYHQDKQYIAVVKDGAGVGRTMLLPPKSSVIGTLQYLLPKDNVLPQYLYYVVTYMRLDRYYTGATIPHIYFRDYREEEFNLSSKDEQQKIVSVLDKLQSIISLRKEQLAKLDELVKARFVEMFGDPVSNSKNWGTNCIKEVAPAINYKGEFKGNKVWLLNLDQIEANSGKILNYIFVDKSAIGNSTCTFDKSNVLYSKLRPYLNKVVMPNDIGFATSELVPLQPKKQFLNREYFAYMLRSESFVKFISDKVAGAKMPRVFMEVFYNFEVPLPKMDLQNQFADFVKQVDKSKVAVQKALDKSQLLFDSLMQEYFG